MTTAQKNIKKVDFKKEPIKKVLETFETGKRPKGGVGGITEGIPSIGGEHLEFNGDFDFTNIRFIPEDFFHEMNSGVIKKQDVLVVKDGATTGKTSFVSDAFPYEKAAINEHIFILRSDKTKITPKYLFYWMMSPLGQKAVQDNFKGTAQGGINTSFFKNSFIEYPEDQDFQKKITQNIETQFSLLEAGEKALERAKINLHRYKASVLKAACEGRLVPTEAELAHKKGWEYEPADVLLKRILQDRQKRWEEEEWQNQIERAKKKAAQAKKKAEGKRGYMRDLKDEEWQDLPEEDYGKYLPKSDKWKKKYQEPDPPDTDGLPELPEGWIWLTLPQIGIIGRGKSKHRPRNDPKLYGGNYPFIQTGDIREAQGKIRKYSQTYNENGLAQSKLWPKGTLCITIAANIAETAILDFDSCFPDSVVGFISSDGISTKFIEYYIRTAKQNLEQYAPATAQKNINLGTLSELAVPLPPKKEQIRIVQTLDKKLSIIENQNMILKENLIKAEQLRQTILKNAFEGKLVN